MNKKVLFAFIGAILRIPLSYYFQNVMIKSKVGIITGSWVIESICKKYFLIFSFSIVCVIVSIPCFSQGKITEEEKYFYNLKVYNSYLLEENPLNVFPSSGRLFTDLRTRYPQATRWCGSWYEAWLYSHYYEQFEQKSKDEFEFKAFVNSKTSEFINKYRNVDFSKTLLYKGSSNFGDYDFSNKGFYIKVSEAFPILEFPVYNYYENFNDNTFLSMNEEDARLFLQKRKDAKGVVNRKLNIETTYSVMNRVMKENKLFIYVQKVTIYDGVKVLKVIYPKTNYFDKIRGIKLQNGIEKVYFDENWNKLYNNDTLRATYNSTIKYKNGSVVNPLLSGIYC